MKTASILILPLLIASAAQGAETQEKTAKTKALETGARALQTNAPAAALDIYLVGVHPMKEEPNKQMEAHHFCRQVNQDFAQCALFDGKAKQANLNGIEYIISEKLYNQLPEKEKRLWHPHNYEILSGMLVAPGLPSAAEKEMLKGKMNSYGKTWHVWNTGHFGMNDAQKMPMGEPHLAWSLNHDGEARPGLLEAMAKNTDINISEKRRERQDLVQFAKPQGGVNAIASGFPGQLRSIPGVVDIEQAGKAPEKESTPDSGSATTSSTQE